MRTFLLRVRMSAAHLLIYIYVFKRCYTRAELMLFVDWTEEETQIPGGNTHLWEESWDDDDTNEDFAVQLR